jgi:serine/threonine protein kinase
LSAVRKSGEEFPVELSLSTWEHDGNRFFTGIIRDISERKRIERKANRYARELSSALHHLESMFATVADLLEGQTLAGRYLLERRLRGDRVGSLYEGLDLEHRTPVNVRVIRAPSQPGALREADRAMHPYSADVLDIGITEVGLPFVVMEPLSGERVSDRLERGKRIEMADALDWCRAVAIAFAEEHSRGDVHGYFCAGTVFLHNADTAAQTIKVLDFEVNRLVRSGSAIADAMATDIGPFCAPEVRRGGTPSFASDVFGLAVLLGILVGGRPPLELDGERGRAEWIRRVLPPELADFASLALASDPAGRPSADAFASAVERAKERYSGPRGDLIGNGY